MLISNWIHKACGRYGLPVLLGVSLWGNQGIAIAQDWRESLLRAADPEVSGAYTRKRFVDLQKVVFDKTDRRKKALILGDSQAQDFLNTVMENGYLSHYQIRTRYIPTRCQLFLTDKGQSFIQAKDTALCAKADNLQLARQQIAEADLIILIAHWRQWAAQLLPETLANLRLRPDQQLVVVSGKELGKVSVRNYLRMSPEELMALRNPINAEQVRINQLLQQVVGTQAFVDQQRLLCTDGRTCPLFTNDLKLISYDGGHLTPEGAKHVGKLLFEKSILGNL